MEQYDNIIPTPSSKLIGNIFLFNRLFKVNSSWHDTLCNIVGSWFVLQRQQPSIEMVRHQTLIKKVY